MSNPFELQSQNSTNELRSLRKDKFLYISIVLSGCCLSLAFMFDQTPYSAKLLLDYASKISLSIAIVLIVNSILRFSQMRTIEKSMREQMFYLIKNLVTNEIKPLVDRSTFIYPSEVYFDGHDFNTDINECINKTIYIRFLSISGKYLLHQRIPSLPMRKHTEQQYYQLMLCNPKSDSGLANRICYIEIYGNKSKKLIDYQVEILSSILQAYCISIMDNNKHLYFRFHSETVVCRLEFCGERDLFLSYYATKDDSTGASDGVVERYLCSSFTYKAHKWLFDSLWERYKDTEISTTYKYTNAKQMLTHISEKLDCADVVSQCGAMIIESLRLTYKTAYANVLTEHVLRWLE